MKTNKLMIAMFGAAAVATTACEKTDRSFSLLDSGSSFQQSATYVPKPIDILWVIDNSGSMKSSQENLTANFQSFINGFQQKGYDYHMAVIGSDAWRAAYQSNATTKALLSGARTGALKFYTNQDTSTNFNNCSGSLLNPIAKLTDSTISVMDALTPNIAQVFLTNATQGICGTGDERPFASLKAFFNDPANSNFRRADASLAVIIVSDEDDFSVNTSSNVAGAYRSEAPSNDPAEDPLVLPFSSTSTDLYNLYKDSRLDTIDSYKTLLDGVAGAGNYNVHMIGVLDTACRTQLNEPVFAGIRLGRRYMQLADATGGAKTSLCADFGQSLEVIAAKAMQLSAVFKLNREPLVETIKVIVNDVEIPNSATDGWTYNAATWEITFAPSAVPNDGDKVQILFTPVRASN
ncbi:MAG: hypothetical protein ACAH59_06240 [Pseudobdellovibrionaceae bacterium]